jgi:hypothetical protein
MGMHADPEQGGFLELRFLHALFGAPAWFGEQGDLLDDVSPVAPLCLRDGVVI